MLYIYIYIYMFFYYKKTFNINIKQEKSAQRRFLLKKLKFLNPTALNNFVAN